MENGNLSDLYVRLNCFPHPYYNINYILKPVEGYELAVHQRKQLAEALSVEGDTWLAKHFFLSCLPISKNLTSPERERIQAEVHCQLAYLTRENSETLGRLYTRL